MHVIKGFLIALSTYSRLPVGGFEWKDEDMRYALVFFPFVGIIIGLLAALWHTICEYAGIGDICQFSIMAAIPLLITGGIHADGYMDTMDGIHSYKSREEKLRILSDPHIGAFSVLMLVSYGLLFAGALAEVIRLELLMPYYCVFFMARIFSGLSVVLFPNARGKGMLQAFSSGADRKMTLAGLIIQMIAAGAFLIYASSPVYLVLPVAAGICMIWYRGLCRKHFGGVTGDTSGFFLLIEELLMTWCVVIIGEISLCI